MPSPPELRKLGHAAGHWLGDEIHVKIGGERIVLRVVDHRPGRDLGYLARVQLHDLDGGTRFPSTLNLTSHASRETFRKGAALQSIPVDPQGLSDACELILGLIEDGAEPFVDLVDLPEPGPVDWFVPGWIPRGEVTCIFGDGGVRKSGLVLATLIAARTGTAVGPWRPQRIAAGLYLDWETHAESLRRRADGYCVPANLKLPPGLIYRRMSGPLSASIRRIRKEVVARGIEVVVIDSAALAAGADPESAEAATRIFEALRPLGVTILLVAHVNRMTAVGGPGAGAPRPYGSVFNQNIPRSAIYVARSPSPTRDSLLITLKQTKLNDEAEQPPVGIRFAFDTAGRWMASTAEPDAAHLSPDAQAVAIIEDAPLSRMTTSEFKEAMGKSTKHAAYQQLQKLAKEGKLINLNPGQKGTKVEAVWGLPAKVSERDG